MEAAMTLQVDGSTYTKARVISLTPKDRLLVYIGTKISIISLKSSPNGRISIDKTQSKFIDIPIQEQSEADKFQFRKAKKSIGSIVTKTSSNFVAKIVASENMAKVLSLNGEHHYLFYNIGKSLCWTDMDWTLKTPLSVIHAKEAYILCHDVNQMTRDAMNAVVGFNTGDILCFWPLSGKYTRLNRYGAISKSAATAVKWIPGSECLFMVGFKDGTVMIFDKDMDDQSYTIPQAKEFYVNIAPKGSKNNPRAFFQVSQTSISAIEFSPDLEHVAIASLDGTLTILEYRSGTRLDVYHSFFGGLQSVAWSPDGKFIVAGSQDDLICLFQFRGRQIASFQGHRSWVFLFNQPTCIAFEEWSCTDKSYKFGSVGDDGHFLMWQFSMGSLGRPKFLSMPRSKSDGEINNKSNSPDTIFHKFQRDSPIIEPISNHRIGPVPLQSLVMGENGILIGDFRGDIHVFKRT